MKTNSITTMIISTILIINKVENVIFKSKLENCKTIVSPELKNFGSSVINGISIINIYDTVIRKSNIFLARILL